MRLFLEAIFELFPDLFSIRSQKSTLDFAIEKLGTTSEQNDRKMIKSRIEDQQLPGEMDLGTTWEQNAPKTG